MTTDEIINDINESLDWYDSVAFIGGEPLEQQEALIDLLKRVKELGLKRWLYTGYEPEEIPKEVAKLTDVIVAGPYVDELKTGGFPASSNQEVIIYKDFIKESECSKISINFKI